MKASLKRWVGRAPDLSAVLARFPVPAVLMALLTLLFIVFDDLPNDEAFGRLMMGLIIGGYAGMMITVAREAHGKSPLIPVQIAVAVLMAIVFWFSESLRINLPMAIGATLALLGNVVLWRKPRNDLHVWDFTHKIWTGAAFATLGSIIFTIGIFAIQAALKSLFGINMNDLFERLLLPIGLALLAPLYWLGTIPPVDESYEELYESPGFVSKAVGFLGTWILSPLTLIYALILLAYAAKIILAGSLPKGEIAQLTAPFLLIGTLTWLALEPPFIQKHGLAKLFRKLWFPISIPAVTMLAISVWVRVSQYGLTEDRIALLLVVIWAFGLAIWFSAGPKARRDIRIIPGLGAILLTIGAVNAQWISVANQSARLDRSLLTFSSQKTPDLKTAASVKGGILYLWSHNSEDKVRDLIASAGYALPNERPNKTQILEALDLKTLNIRRTDEPVREIKTNYQHSKNPTNIDGYSKLYDRYSYNASAKNEYQVAMISDIKVMRNGTGLVFYQNDQAHSDYDLKSWVMALPIEADKIIINEDRVVVFEDGERKIAIAIDSLHRTDRPGSDEPFKANMQFYLISSGF